MGGLPPPPPPVPVETSGQVLTRWAGRSGPWRGAAEKPAWTAAAVVARWAGWPAHC